MIKTRHQFFKSQDNSYRPCFKKDCRGVMKKVKVKNEVKTYVCSVNSKHISNISK